MCSVIFHLKSEMPWQISSA